MAAEPATLPELRPGTLSIQMLGGLACTNNRLDPAIPAKGWALLAHLIMEPGTSQTRERLAATFWPNHPADAARNNLRQVLLILQRALCEHEAPHPCLIADRNSIHFNPDCRHRFDVLEFAREVPQCAADLSPSNCEGCLGQMAAVAALYQGEFMAGICLADCPDFEEWLKIQRERLRRHALVLLERLADCYETFGATAKALSAAMRFTELEPWNEEGQRRCIRLLTISGQRATAIDFYESCRRTLKQELDVQPEDATQKLMQRVRDGELAPTIGDDSRQSPPTAAVPLAVERRQVTVLFGRLATAASDDPDQELELLSEPNKRCIEIIQRFSGHVVRTNDGGLLAYFGFPRAHENAALLAVRAALALCQLELRVGVHTGLIITSSVPGLPDPIGKTSGTAMRLLTLAAPGTVTISAATHRLVSGYFEVAAVDQHGVQGETLARNVFRVVRESGACDRLAATPALSTLIGRNSESESLTRLWQKAGNGQRQALLLSGDPGIGKSRLVWQFKRQLAESHVMIRELRCSAEFAHSPFHPLISLFEQLLGFGPDEAPGAKFDKLVAYVAQQGDANRSVHVPLLASLLSLPTRPPYKTRPLLPQQLRDLTMDFLIEHLYASTNGSVGLLIVEDLHWIDPSTLELLTRFLADQRPAPMLVLLTARPEFKPSWPTDQALMLTIPPLADNDMAVLVTALALGNSVATVRDIVDRSDGIPLFAEELARTLPSAADDRFFAIPTTLQDLLAARLDSLGEAKFTAQLAATIGREFHLDLLCELAQVDRLALLRSLRRLCDVGLVSGDIDSGFQFRHALFQDAAYQSQTRTDRQAMHRRIAEVLQSRFADLAQRRPEMLARHWTAAGVAETATEFWIKAGRWAGRHYAHKEVISHLKSGLKLLDDINNAQAKIRLEFELQIGLGSAYYATEGYGSPSGVLAYCRAVALGEGQANTRALFQAFWGLWASTSSRSNYQASLALTQRLIRMSDLSNDPVEQQQAHFAAGNIQFWRGEFQQARVHLERAMSLYRPRHHERLITGFGENAFVTSGSFLSWTLCYLGLPDQARAVSRRTVATARRIKHPFSLGYGLTFATVLHRMLRQPTQCLKLAEETISLAVLHGFPLWEAGATLKQGWALVMLGRFEGVERMRRSVESMRIVMSSILVIFLETLADSLRQLGQYDQALVIIEEAQAAGGTLGDRHVEAELHRLKGECLLGLATGNEVQAESCFQQAIDISHAQLARLAELRASLSMARLWHAQGRTKQAHQLLMEAYTGFTEGFKTPDLQQAERFLAQLVRCSPHLVPAGA